MSTLDKVVILLFILLAGALSLFQTYEIHTLNQQLTECINRPFITEVEVHELVVLDAAWEMGS